jgi:hypothetical protein
LPETLTEISLFSSRLGEVICGKTMKAKNEFEREVRFTRCDSLWYRMQTHQLIDTHALIFISASTVVRVHNLWE